MALYIHRQPSIRSRIGRCRNRCRLSRGRSGSSFRKARSLCRSRRRIRCWCRKGLYRLHRPRCRPCCSQCIRLNWDHCIRGSCCRKGSIDHSIKTLQFRIWCIHCWRGLCIQGMNCRKEYRDQCNRSWGFPHGERYNPRIGRFERCIVWYRHSRSRLNRNHPCSQRPCRPC